MTTPIRVLLTKGGLDGHDRGILVVAAGLRDAGLQVIYGGMYQSPEEVAWAAIQEDVDVIGVSNHSGGYMYFFERLSELLGEYIDEFVILVGGIIRKQDHDILSSKYGVSGIFHPGTEISEIVEACKKLRKRKYDPRLMQKIKDGDSHALARFITSLGGVQHDKVEELLWQEEHMPEIDTSHVVGISGQGGAGKSTLLARMIEHIAKEADASLGVLCVDPLAKSGGAFLADRIRMNSELLSQSPGIFVRSIAPPLDSKPYHGVTRSTPHIIAAMKMAGKDRIFVESMGMGQQDEGFGELVDTLVYVVTPDSGDDMQILKGGGIETADIIVLNKEDNPGADSMVADLEQYIAGERSDGWTVPVLRTVSNATDEKSTKLIAKVLKAIENHKAFLNA